MLYFGRYLTLCQGFAIVWILRKSCLLSILLTLKLYGTSHEFCLTVHQYNKQTYLEIADIYCWISSINTRYQAWAHSGVTPLLKANYGYGSDCILISPMATYGFPINLHITSFSTSHHFLIKGCTRIQANKRTYKEWNVFSIHWICFVNCIVWMNSNDVSEYF